MPKVYKCQRCKVLITVSLTTIQASVGRSIQGKHFKLPHCVFPSFVILWPRITQEICFSVVGLRTKIRQFWDTTFHIWWIVEDCQKKTALLVKLLRMASSNPVSIPTVSSSFSLTAHPPHHHHHHHIICIIITN